jgi:succinate dehydrogenase / fumarate reductase iron-sulfur subunit
MNLTLHIWRQASPTDQGRFVTYEAHEIEPEYSFLEMLDVLNERLAEQGKEPVGFEHDCREGVCGSCAIMINGTPHGKERLTATCQLHMRKFADGEEIWIEPWRSRSLPVLKDLITDRSALDRIIAAGGFISVRTGSAPEANSVPVPRPAAEAATDAAACIGCGACVAACPNGSAMLFTAAKIAHLGLLPQGQPERWARARAMVEQMDREGFGNCSNHGACETVCPKGITVDTIARLNRDLVTAMIRE